MNPRQKIGAAMLAIPFAGGIGYCCWMDPRGLIVIGICAWIVTATGLITHDDRPDIPSGRDELGPPG